ncbi:hypothetical protein [Luteimicrobium album]|uniref:hypothetical protein n=1 Tax=Luteimicrobium album TaxID=1054550 RepID=UPI0024E0A5B6|nr:hypothetical protein [Luteimicrobium album]
MTFYPDGEVRIPHEKDPVPQPDDPAVAARRFTRLLVRTAFINGVILAVAVIIAYVVPVTDDENVQLAVILVAALVCAAHMSWIVLRDPHRRSRAVEAARTGLYPG